MFERFHVNEAFDKCDDTDPPPRLSPRPPYPQWTPQMESKEPYNEETARTLCGTMVRAIRYVHRQDIVHRDINPGSFVLATPGDEASIKLTGFGVACSFHHGLVTTPVYTDAFLAPEILKGKPHGPVRFFVRLHPPLYDIDGCVFSRYPKWLLS